jgi:hypothetical protein
MAGMQNIVDGLAGAIGNTPLIRLKRASEMTGCEILGKAEFMNPGQSVKDRAALYIIKDAIERGTLKPGGTIVEGTAGNTGIGLALVGAFGVSDNPVNLMLLAGFGLLGYVMVLFGFPPAPLILGFVLGDAMERAVRQSLTMSMGDPTILVERPLSAVMLALALLVLLSPILSRLLRRRSVATAS